MKRNKEEIASVPEVIQSNPKVDELILNSSNLYNFSIICFSEIYFKQQVKYSYSVIGSIT